MDYEELDYKELEEYRRDLKERTEFYKAVDRLVESKDFNTVFNKDKINDRIIKIQKFLVHTPESKEEVLKELTFYAYLNKHLETLQLQSEYVKEEQQKFEEYEKSI